MNFKIIMLKETASVLSKSMMWTSRKCKVIYSDRHAHGCVVGSGNAGAWGSWCAARMR